MFSYWSKFHVNIITGSRVATIFLDKELGRNLEIENTSIWVLANIWRLGWFTDTKFGWKVSNEMLLNAAKSQDYSFCRFSVIKENSTGGGGGSSGASKTMTPSPYTQVRVKKRIQHRCFPLEFMKFLRTPISKNICKNNCSLIFLPWKLSLLKYLKSFSKFTGDTRQNL